MGKVNVAQVTKPIMPYFIIMVLALLVITFVPWISLAIPVLLGYTPVVY